MVPRECRSAAARARSGVKNVAITASPIVLTTATSFGRHDLVQYAEMLADEVVSDQIAHALVECCRALEIERVGVIKIAKCLIGEEPFSGKERPPLGEKMMKRIAGNPERGQHVPVSVVLNRLTQLAGPQLHRVQWGPDLGKDDRQRLPVAVGRTLSRTQSCSLRNVSQLARSPDFKPVVNHRERCAEVPWVKASGTT
jgi:hypothetical protein